MEYTKGEWRAENFNRLEDGDWRLSCNGHSIMRLVGLLKQAENKANANLIAAAPAQNQALSEIDHWLMANPNISNDPQLHIIHIHIQDALVKAEGKPK